MGNATEFENKIFKRGPVAAIYGCSLGDEGKGKATGLFNNIDYMAVAVGGANAGHTVYYNGNKIVLHELPGGCIIESAEIYVGQGRVMNISGLVKEIKDVESTGCSIKGRIVIAGNTQIIFKSLQIKLDGVIEKAKSKAVGTTNKGIGPAYALKALRTGINVNIALNNPKEALDFINTNCAIFNSLDKDEIWTEFQEEIAVLNDLINTGYVTIDSTNMLINKGVAAGKRILVEASQSAMLAIDGGMYPYCTSSDTSINGIMSSLNISKVDTGIGVVKAIKSKVGGGFFPTKLPEDIAGPYRELSGEFGATTGRPRDVGYFDAVEMRLVLSENKTDVLLITKADMLRTIPEVKIGLSYTGKSGKQYLCEIPSDADEYASLAVNYSQSFKLEGDIFGFKSVKDLPTCYREYFDFLIESLNFKGTLILGTGPENDQYLIYN